MYEELKEYRFMATLQDVERAAVPFPDTITIEFPDPEQFREITEQRRERYQMVDLKPRSEATRRIDRALEKEVDMNYPEASTTTLEDFLKFIKEQTTSDELRSGIPIYVDPIGLQEVSKSLSDKISIDLNGVRIRRGLKLVLDQLDLIYTVKDGLLSITSKESETQELDMRVYPVADLALIPLSLIQGGGGGMGGMGGGMGGMGGGFRSMPVFDPAQGPGSNPFLEKKSN
jgi:hypothetical protein